MYTTASRQLPAGHWAVSVGRHPPVPRSPFKTPIQRGEVAAGGGDTIDRASPRSLGLGAVEGRGSVYPGTIAAASFFNTSPVVIYIGARTASTATARRVRKGHRMEYQYDQREYITQVVRYSCIQDSDFCINERVAIRVQNNCDRKLWIHMHAKRQIRQSLQWGTKVTQNSTYAYLHTYINSGNMY